MSTIISLDPNSVRALEVPPLQAGDHLTRTEFERRYKAMPHITKAELIEGVVYMPYPVSLDHSPPHSEFVTWLGTYRAYTPGIESGDNGTLRLDLDNEPQPDGYLRILPEYGGQSRTVEKYVEGAPEFIAEVAASSASYDLHNKLNAYRRNGVQEYAVWRVWDRAIDWFVLRADEFRPLAPNAAGLYQSTFFPGCGSTQPPSFVGTSRGVLDVVRDGLTSPEHAAFVAKLAAAKAANDKPA